MLQGLHKNYLSVFHLVSWLDEDAVSNVPSKSVLSKPGEELKPGCVCQVNIVASRTKDALITSANIIPALISSNTIMHVGTRQQMESSERRNAISEDESVENISSPPTKKCTQCTSKLCILVHVFMHVRI